MYTHMYTHDMCICNCTYLVLQSDATHGTPTYPQSPLQDSRLLGPRPWKILAATYETNGFLSNPDTGENLVMENLVMETGCIMGLARPGRAFSRVGSEKTRIYTETGCTPNSHHKIQVFSDPTLGPKPRPLRGLSWFAIVTAYVSYC